MFSRNFFIAMFAASFGLASVASAQYKRVESAVPIAWTTFVGQQLAASLESPSADIRTSALEQVTLLARSFGDEIDLTETVPSLTTIYRSDPDVRCRLAAVVGLQAIDDETGFQHLRKGIWTQESKLVQHVVLAVLMEHYGPDTLEGDRDMAEVAESVIGYYRDLRLTPPSIASTN